MKLIRYYPLFFAADLRTFPLTLLLAPFLQTILSPRVSAPITSAALQSVNRMLVYQVIPLPVSPPSFSSPRQSQPPGLRSAVVDIARAISHCKFEPSDPTVDELVLLRIVAVMKELVCGTKQVNEDGQGSTLADFLPDESICEMMETGLSMCCQTRLTGEVPQILAAIGGEHAATDVLLTGPPSRCSFRAIRPEYAVPGNRQTPGARRERSREVEGRMNKLIKRLERGYYTVGQ